MNENIIVYTSAICPVCNMVKQFLSDMNLTYKEVNVDLKPLEVAKLVRQTRKLSVPQTNVYGEWVFGFDPVRMLEILNKSMNENV